MHVQRQIFSVDFSSDNAGHPIIPVNIGGQPFMVVLDTGGWTRWIPSSKSTSVEFANKKKYTGQAETSVSMNEEYETSYSGEKYKGNVMIDQLRIAGRMIPHFTFAEVVESSGAVDDRKGYDGIFGMRRPPESAESCKFLKTTFLDFIMDAKLVNDAIFTFRFCGQPGVRGDSWFVRGNLNFGETRWDYYHPPIVNLPLHQGTQWVIDITSIQFGDVTLCNPCRAHVDTGSPDAFAPAEVSNVFLKNSVVEKHTDGMLHVCPHNLHLVRPLKIKLQSHVFTLPPQELTRYTVGFHHFAIQANADSGDTTWTLGVSLLRHFYLLFDQQSYQMGFAAVKC